MPADPDTERRRKGLEFVAKLSLFVSENAPDSTSEAKVHAVAMGLQKHYGYSFDLKKQLALQFIVRSEFASAGELMDHFGWNQPDTSRVLNDLSAAGRIEQFQR